MLTLLTDKSTHEGCPFEVRGSSVAERAGGR